MPKLTTQNDIMLRLLKAAVVVTLHNPKEGAKLLKAQQLGDVSDIFRISGDNLLKNALDDVLKEWGEPPHAT